MALTLANLFTSATSVGAYINNVSAACAVAAVAVVKESDQTPNHAARLAWAQKTLVDPVGMGKKVIWGVLADPVIIAALPGVTDAQVQTSVNGLVDSFVNA
jgi:hypothetical protein